MHDDEALLEAIRANPDDDALRLIYADYLEEQGDARAELIRAAVTLTTMKPDDAGYERQAELVRQLETAWRQEILPTLVLAPDTSFHSVCTLSKGLPERVALPLSSFLEQPEACRRWLRLGPIRALDLVVDCGVVTALETVAELRQLRALHTAPKHEFRLGDTGVAELLSVSHWANLTELGIHAHDLNLVGVRSLAEAPCCAGLTSLSLPGNRFGAAGIELLGQTSWVPQLHELHLDGNKLGPIGAQFLAQMRLPQLRTLTLCDASLTSQGLRALASAPFLPQLTQLALTDNMLGAEGMEALTRVPLAQLRRLDLTRNDIGSRGAQALGSAVGLPRLQRLELGQNVLNGNAIRSLATPALASLQWLDLSNNDIGDEGLFALADAAALARLRILRLWGTRCTPWGVKALASSPHLGSLRILDLSGNELGDDTLRTLAAFPHLSELRYLLLDDTRITDAGLQALAQSRHLPRLHTLSLANTDVTDAGLRHLAGAPRLPTLRRLDVSGSTEVTRQGLLDLVDRAGPSPLVVHCNHDVGDSDLDQHRPGRFLPDALRYSLPKLAQSVLES